MNYLILAAIATMSLAPDHPNAIFPGKTWEYRSPERTGVSRDKLDALRDLVSGRGCVVRNGYMVYTWGEVTKISDIASAVKPVISTLLLMAVQEGRIRSVDSKVSEFEPRLKEEIQGKNARITWRQLASQTSGYGLTDDPGTAWAYNDMALALYYDSLMGKVYNEDGDQVLKTRLAGPLEFEDRSTFNAFGRDDRLGRLAISVRDFARFGLLYLRGGTWNGRQTVSKELIRKALTSVVPADLPRTSGGDGPMLKGQRTLGGGKNLTPIGPGYYSFNWWTNGQDAKGRRLFEDLPKDTFIAAGHGGIRMLWVIPKYDLIVVWNDARIEDFDDSPSNRMTRCNQAARLIKEVVLR